MSMADVVVFAAGATLRGVGGAGITGANGPGSDGGSADNPTRCRQGPGQAGRTGHPLRQRAPEQHAPRSETSKGVRRAAEAS